MYNNGKVDTGIGYVTATDEIWEVLESVVSETINMALHTAITMIPVVNIVILHQLYHPLLQIMRL